MKNLKSFVAVALLASLTLNAVHAHAAARPELIPTGCGNATGAITATIGNLGATTAPASVVYVGTKPPMIVNGILMTSVNGAASVYELVSMPAAPMFSSTLIKTHLPAAHNTWVYVVADLNRTNTVKAFWVP